jgi:CBS domain-containing protein
MLKVKDVMTKNVICVEKDIPVVEAIRLMAKNNITGVPVVEDDMTPVGLLSEQDVLRLLHTHSDEKDRAVHKFMSQPAIHFDEEAPFLDVCYHLRENPMRRIPVTSQGKVIGIISRSDILRCILQLCDEDVVLTVGACDNTEQ